MQLGAGVGRVLQLLARRRVRIADTNLRLCYPQMSSADRERLLKANFAAMGKGLMEVSLSWWGPQATVDRLLSVEGAEHLQSDDGRGTIFLTAHFSSLELSARYLGSLSRSYAMYRPNENPVIQEMFDRHRARLTQGNIPREDVRTMVRVLKEGDGVWFAPDQDYKHKGKVFVDFMGVPAATHTATSRFAKVSGARVLPFVLLRERNGYRLYIEPPLDNFPSGDVQLDTQKINDLYGKWVSLAPEQYNWIHRRFKTRPNGEPSPYKKDKK